MVPGTAVGLHSDTGPAGADAAKRLSVKLWELLGPVAVIIADCVLAMVPAFTLNFADEAPAAMETLLGTVSNVLLLASFIETEDAAVLVKASVQLELPAE
jgi:hypothetical protein